MKKTKTLKGENLRPRGSGTQSVYSILRNEILEMRLAPASPLDEVSLSERFGMSRTPVREALLKLAAEGLVTTLPNRNTIVAPIDFSTLPAYFEALMLMYRITTRNAAARHGKFDMDEIMQRQKAFVAAVETTDALGMIEANREFHVAIARAGGNPFYVAFFTRLLDEGRRILRLYYSTFDDHLPLEYAEEHSEIIRAIETGDVELADRLGVRHAQQIIRQIQDFVARDAHKAANLENL